MATRQWASGGVFAAIQLTEILSITAVRVCVSDRTYEINRHSAVADIYNNRTKLLTWVPLDVIPTNNPFIIGLQIKEGVEPFMYYNIKQNLFLLPHEFKLNNDEQTISLYEYLEINL